MNRFYVRDEDFNFLCRKRCEENRVCHDNDIGETPEDSWERALPTENIC
jgi:hypothetical protein